MNSLRGFTKDTSLYAVGVFFQRFVSLLLIPAYARLLSTKEYGIYETIFVVSQTLLIFFDLGISRAILRFCTIGRDQNDAKEILRTAVVISLLISAIFLLLSPFFASFLSTQLLKDKTYAVALLGAIFWTYGLELNQLQFAFFRARQEVSLYLRVSVIQAIFTVLLNVLFVVFMKKGINGIIVANIISTWALSAYTVKNGFGLKKTLSIPWGIEMLKFGFPLFFSMIGLFILNSADRYILAYYRDMTEVGIYGLGYKVGLLVNIGIITPFQLAWPNFVFEQEESKNVERNDNYGRILIVLLGMICTVSLLVFMFAKEIIIIIGTEKFIEGSLVVPYIVLAYLFYAIYYYYGGFFLFAGKTTRLSLITIFMALTNILLNLLWIPKYGWWGAAWSTVITVFGLGLSTAIYGRKLFPYDFQYKKVILMLILTGVAGLEFVLMKNNGIANILLPRPLVLVSFFTSLFIFKIVEFSQIRSSFLSLLGKK